MRKSKILISTLLIITILSISIQSFAKSFELSVKFNGKDIVMESETTDMTWELNNFLPGNSDTSSITITNAGEKPATVETTISIEEDTGLLEMIDLTVTNKEGDIVYTGSYTDLETITKSLKPGEIETYTAKTSLNINAGNEYQDKQYKLKFNFKAIGEVPFGKLTIKYVDENGKDLEPPTIETKKITSEKYNLPETGKTFEGYSFDRVEGELTGEYKEEGTTVIYHYNKIKYGKLIVKHVDEDGKILEESEDTKVVGTKYSLENAGKFFEGYEFERVEGNTTGEYVEGETVVTYYYNKIKYGKLIVQYVDTEGNLLEQTSETKRVGTDYTLSETGKEIEGYTFLSVEGETTGIYKEEDTIVKYIYEKIVEIERGKLIVKYLDQADNLLDEEVYTEKVGELYELEVVGKEFEGYDFIAVEGETAGEYKKEDTIVIYRYKKRESGKVIIIYVDENENELDRKTTTGIVDRPYSFTEKEIIKEIPEYEFKKIEGEKEGLFKIEDTIIYCRYERIKKGRLIVLCIDENNEIIKQTITTERVGTVYNLSEVGEEIEGYKFLGIEGEPKGKYKVEDTIVKYRYESIKDAPVTEDVKLPQTGQFKYIYIILGVFIGGLIFFLILAKKKKKDEEEQENVENNDKK